MSVPGYQIDPNSGDAAVEVVAAWERFTAARTPTEEASALIHLSNCMGDLASWVPDQEEDE